MTFTTNYLLKKVEFSSVLWLLVSIAANTQAWFGKKGDEVKIFTHFVHITYPSTPLIEGPASPSGCISKAGFFTISVGQRDKTTQIRIILLKSGWVDSMCM